MSHNMVGLQGRLGADPEIRYLEPSGVPRTKVNIAVDIPTGKDAEGKTQKRAAWVTLKAYEKTAIFLCDHFKKGDQILVTGRLDMDNWTDEKTGQKRSMLYVRVDRLDFCGGKRESTYQSPGEQEMANRPPRNNSESANMRDDAPPDHDSEIPF